MTLPNDEPWPENWDPQLRELGLWAAQEPETSSSSQHFNHDVDEGVHAARETAAGNRNTEQQIPPHPPSAFTAQYAPHAELDDLIDSDNDNTRNPLQHYNPPTEYGIQTPSASTSSQLHPELPYFTSPPPQHLHPYGLASPTTNRHDQHGGHTPSNWTWSTSSQDQVWFTPPALNSKPGPGSSSTAAVHNPEAFWDIASDVDPSFAMLSYQEQAALLTTLQGSQPLPQPACIEQDTTQGEPSPTGSQQGLQSAFSWRLIQPNTRLEPNSNPTTSQGPMSIAASATPSQASAYTCSSDGCGKSFKDKSGLDHHTRYHKEPNNPWICTICEPNTVWRWKKEYHKHLTTHSEERPWLCTQLGCTKTFKRRDHMLRHMQNVHGMSSASNS
ncbi:unnamed protein product [Zymoseptoria tritici ST99CH_1A5]|uniref:C2H2 type master regulator of conidiophore development brlA n=2 Tax=Zymoseptoria tritici TaxID=1047171 RepID=A0A2H1GHG0_ZYMTR|nr:unnamed protein product [Zymoseptoria tritici ST99CH_1E4]SMR54465.1 unnamed protein product [Zymoseptoria tritici ST99CH_3D1]SMY24717.1 unnamed protein product [Zymoseptoria tritici ST99CH_1A5]